MTSRRKAVSGALVKYEVCMSFEDNSSITLWKTYDEDFDISSIIVVTTV